MILAIDLGSTSFKAAIYDRQLTQLGSGSAPVEHLYGEGNAVELPVTTAVVAFAGAIAAALADAQVAADELTAIAIDSQGQTFTIVDAEGQPRMPFISWQDQRPVEACAALADEPGFDRLAEHCSFGELLPALQLCQLRRLRDQQPAFIQPSDRILHLPTFLVSAISGETVIEDNLAAMSGTWSLALRSWWPEALAAISLTPDQFPRVVPVGTIAAHTTAAAEAVGLPAGLPIILAGNDQTAGGYGAHVAEQGASLITLGTAQVIYAAGPAAAPAGPGLVRGPYPGGLHYTLACDDVGGSVITWAQKVLTGASSAQAFFALAAQAEAGCNGLRFRADLHRSEAAWQGLGFAHGPPEMARAIVEALAERIAEMVARLPKAPDRCLVAGGGTQSQLWRDILAERLGIPLERVTANPLDGGARMAMDAIAKK